MSASCPKCKRKTWSVKWKSCTGCGFREGQATLEGALDTPAPQKKQASPAWKEQRYGDPVTENVTNGNGHAKRDGNVTNGVTPGEVCPTCHRKVPMTAVQRKKRQRTKGAV